MPKSLTDTFYQKKMSKLSRKQCKFTFVFSNLLYFHLLSKEQKFPVDGMYRMGTASFCLVRASASRLALEDIIVGLKTLLTVSVKKKFIVTQSRYTWSLQIILMFDAVV